MKKYIIEVEETKAETVVNLLAQISVKVGKSTEEKKHYIKIEACGYGESDSFLCLTEEQFDLLSWLSDNGYFEDWSEVDPTEMFEEI
jgi:hypothetical protein